MDTYYRTQLEVAEILVQKIALFWEKKISEQEISLFVKTVVGKNYDLIFNEEGFTKAVEKRLGKKRSNLIKQLINMEDN